MYHHGHGQTYWVNIFVLQVVSLRCKSQNSSRVETMGWVAAMALMQCQLNQTSGHSGNYSQNWLFLVSLKHVICKTTRLIAISIAAMLLLQVFKKQRIHATSSPAEWITQLSACQNRAAANKHHALQRPGSTMRAFDGKFPTKSG